MVITNNQIKKLKNALLIQLINELQLSYEQGMSSGYTQSFFDLASFLAKKVEIAVNSNICEKKSIYDFIDIHFQFGLFSSEYSENLRKIISFPDLINSEKIEAIYKYLKFNKMPF